MAGVRSYEGGTWPLEEASHTEEAAIDEAQREGYVKIGSAWYCPDCVKALRQEEQRINELEMWGPDGRPSGPWM